jgi:hypothetical protein
MPCLRGEGEEMDDEEDEEDDRESDADEDVTAVGC